MTDTVAETFQALFGSLKLLSPAPAPDERLGDALNRAPSGHPAHEIAMRTVKCNSCGGLAPLKQTSWLVDDDKQMEPVCRFCSSPEVVMWKPAVAGHA